MTFNSPKTLATTALAVAMLGGMALPAYFNSPTPAFADAVKVEGAVQIPSFADVVSVVSPAVVSVQVEGARRVARTNERGRNRVPEQFRGSPFERFFEERGRGNRDDRRRGQRRGSSQGSGFFISDDGYVVTNNHVVENGTKFTVVMNDGTKLDADLIGTDPRTDLAVLKVQEKRDFTYVDFADEKDIRVGDWAVAVGNPFGLGGTVTAGIVSARGRDIGSGPYDDFLQIDAAVNRGNSGGPTFNLNGEVIGVNTAIFSPSGGNVGIAFAIPATTTVEVVDELIDNGAVKRGWLGVRIQPVTNDVAEALGLELAKGAIIADANPEGPAFDAGLKAGDIVLSVNDETIDDPKDLATTIAEIDPGSDASLLVWRDGQSKNLTVKLGELPEAAQLNASISPKAPEPKTMEKMGDLGLELTTGPDGKVVIADVAPDSDAARKGFRSGDTVTAINGALVANIKDVGKAVAAAEKAGRIAVLFQLQGERGTRFIALPTQNKG